MDSATHRGLDLPEAMNSAIHRTPGSQTAIDPGIHRSRPLPGTRTTPPAAPPVLGQAGLG